MTAFKGTKVHSSSPSPPKEKLQFEHKNIHEGALKILSLNFTLFYRPLKIMCCLPIGPYETEDML
jgi:hypothetical protein